MLKLNNKYLNSLVVICEDSYFIDKKALFLSKNKTNVQNPK